VRRVRLSIADPSGENELRIRVRTMQLIVSIVLLMLRLGKWVLSLERGSKEAALQLSKLQHSFEIFEYCDLT